MSTADTGSYNITLKDSVADALSIRRATTDMILFDSSTPKITITPAVDISGILTVNTAGSPADGIKISATTPTDGLEISSACGSHAINISGAQTGAGITIANTCGTYGLNIAGACTTAAINIAAPTTVGILMAGDAAYNPIQIGTKANDKTGGLNLVGATDDTGGVMIFADNNDAALGSVTSPLWTRYLITSSQSAGPTAAGLFGQIKSITGLTFTTGVYTAVKAYNQIGGTLAVVTGAEVSALSAAITLEGALTNTSGRVSGIDVNINTAANIITDTATDTAGVHIRKTSTSTYGWPVGLKINDAGATTGIQIGTCTTGINVEGTVTLALGIGSTTPLTTATSAMSAVKVYSDYSKADGYHVGSWFSSKYTGDGTGIGSVYTLRGHVDFEGTQTTSSTAQFLSGVHGRAAVTGTIYNSQLVISGITAQLLAGGTLTAVRQMSALWVDNQMATNPTAGNCDMVWISNNNEQAGVVDHIFRIYGANVQGGLFAFDSCMVGSNGFITDGVVAHAGDMIKIKCTADGDDYYLLASTAPA